MDRQLLSGLFVFLFATMALLHSHLAAAQQNVADRSVAFSIPAQPLDTALAEYFRATGVQLLYDSALTAGRRSTAIQGNHAPRAALRQMLAGTGLIARYSRTNAAIITTPESAVSAPLVPLGRVVVRERMAARRPSLLERLEYYDRLEAQLQTRLRDDDRTGQMAFDVVASLSIAGNGLLTDVRIHRGSGDTQADRLVTQVLSGGTVSRPPDGLAQPLRIILKGRKR